MKRSNPTNGKIRIDETRLCLYIVKGFTAKYCIDKLGYYEVTSNIESAIKREKQLKSGSGKKKLDLIETMNPDWQDLYYEIVE